MTTATAITTATDEAATATRTGERARRLAARLEDGALALATLAHGLTDAEWRRPIPGDGRTIGVVVHHVASVYPIEVELAQRIASGMAISGVTMADIHAMNAGHAEQFAGVARLEAITLLRIASSAAADAIRAFSDSDLDMAATASLYDDAPVTAQFVLEDHAVRHSYHHLAAIRRALAGSSTVSRHDTINVGKWTT